MFEDNINLGINESGLSNLTADFMTIADNVSLILDEIDQKFATLDEYLKCEATKDIKQKYKSIKDNYTIIKNNIISYSDDMAILNQKMAEGSKYIVNIVNAEEENIKNKQKEVNNKC